MPRKPARSREESSRCARSAAASWRARASFFSTSRLSAFPRASSARCSPRSPRFARAGVTVLLVEQNVAHALALADHACVLETGRVTLTGCAQDLAGDPRVKEKFLGVSGV